MPPASLARGGGAPGKAHEDEDLPLLDEDLVPPLLRGLPERRSLLDNDAVLGGEGHEGRDVAAQGVAVTGGQHVWGSRNIRVGGLVPRLSTRHDDGTRHVEQVFKRIGDTVVEAVSKFFNKGTCHSPVFGRVGLVPLGEDGSFLCSSTGFTWNIGSKC